MNPARAIMSVRRKMFSDWTNFKISILPVCGGDFVPTETSSPASVSSSCSLNSSVNTSSASFIANGLQLELHPKKESSQKKKDLLVRKNKNRRAKASTEKKKIQNLQKLCQHIMSIEFSLTYGLAVIMKYPRILELCKRK